MDANRNSAVVVNVLSQGLYPFSRIKFSSQGLNQC